MTAQRVAALRRLAKVWGASGATATAEAPVAAALINEALDAVEALWREVENGRKVEAAARALLADLADLHGDAVCPCNRSECSQLATVYVLGESLCDECIAGYSTSKDDDLSYAPAVRALRAALAEVP